MPLVVFPGLDALIRLALDEDAPSGDPTTEAVVDGSVKGTGEIVARDPLVVAGLQAAARVFTTVDETITFEPAAKDGDAVDGGSCLARVSGPLRGLLRGERPALNFLQRLSGVATWTRRHVERAAGTACTVADTRKTTPGWRHLEKHAVVCGGGVNHRLHLGDLALVKDNHLRIAGGVKAAVAAIRAYSPGLPVEVECDTLAQVRAALEVGVEGILLDNMSPARCREAVGIIGGRVPVEASGGIRLDNLADYAAAGVDRVALGSLTHSAPAADVAFDLVDPPSPPA